jgi:hypothetical protein
MLPAMARARFYLKCHSEQTSALPQGKGLPFCIALSSEHTYFLRKSGRQRKAEGAWEQNLPRFLRE